MEKQEEFERLERQSRLEAYSFETELNGFDFPESSKVLDAGCGSGVVARYLASKHPGTEVQGWDASGLRIQQAREAAQKITNLSFEQRDLLGEIGAKRIFDRVVCRYVVEHVPHDSAQRLITNLQQSAKPGGKVRVIDVDGLFLNLYPQTPLVRTTLLQLRNQTAIDLNVGRKIPQMMEIAGFKEIECKVQVLNFQGEALVQEAAMIEERFMLAKDFFLSVIQDEFLFKQFVTEYLDCLRTPGATLFYNMFIVSGTVDRKMLLREVASK